MRLIGARTRPDLKREQTLVLNGGFTVVHVQFVPAALGTLRGFSTRFHLYAVESESGAVEPDDVRLLIFRGADACAFVGGDGEAAALARVDAVIAAQGYANVPIVFGAETHDAVARGRALGFPDADAFALDSATGAGVFEAFKLVAKKILSTLAGQTVTSRPTPVPGAVPLAIDPNAPRAARTLEEMQVGLADWQRAYHAKVIWALGYAVPITTEEHREISGKKLTGDRMAAWLAERSATVLDRWLPNQQITSATLTVRKGACNDINGDGYADVVAGATGYRSGTGRVYVFHSTGSPGVTATLAASASPVISGEASSYFGVSVATVDANGAGYIDVVAGAYTHSNGTGRVYVFHSMGSPGVTATAATAASTTITGQATSDFGYSLAP